MRPWPAPDLPVLPDPPPAEGREAPPPVRLTDSATGALRVGAEGPTARLYVCGITPYDATHLGHAATYLAFDLLNRAWRDAGHEVVYVQNVTDVDDPLLERARLTGQDWRELAAGEISRFADDMAALRVLPPAVWQGVTEAVPAIAAAVTALMDAGAAYRVGADGDSDGEGEGEGEGEGDVYFAVSADPRFGQVAHLDAAAARALSAERGGDPDRPGKRHPLDPLLWRAARAGEPSWPGGALGQGRPGWHIECTVIAADALGLGFDVQGGGSDLLFPHHEMSASHGNVLHGWPFARVYAHAGMVGLDGVKMSKSLGNLVLVSALRSAGVDPMAVRLAVLAHPWRSDWSWTDQGLAEAEQRLARWRAAVVSAAAADAGDAASSEPSAPAGQGTRHGGSAVLAAVRERLADDLDAPGALAEVDAWAEAALAGHPSGSGGALVRDVVDALLGVAL